jgi:antitoxin component of MazEF toxin-antitoxin module
VRGSVVFEFEIEVRPKVGLPADVLAAVGLEPGARVQLQVRQDKRMVLVPVAEVVDRFAGAAPGLSAAANLAESRDV